MKLYNKQWALSLWLLLLFYYYCVVCVVRRLFMAVCIVRRLFMAVCVVLQLLVVVWHFCEFDPFDPFFCCFVCHKMRVDFPLYMRASLCYSFIIFPSDFYTLLLVPYTSKCGVPVPYVVIQQKDEWRAIFYAKASICSCFYFGIPLSRHIDDFLTYFHLFLHPIF